MLSLNGSRPLQWIIGMFFWSSNFFFNFHSFTNVFFVGDLYLQFPKMNMIHLVTLLKWGHFDRAKPNKKMLLASWNFTRIWKGLRSFNAKNLGSVDQRVAKLPDIKDGGLKKKSTFQPRPHSNRSSRVWEHLGSKHTQSLMANNFPALQTSIFQH